MRKPYFSRKRKGIKVKTFPFKFVIFVKSLFFLIRLFSVEKCILSTPECKAVMCILRLCLNQNGYKLIPGLTSKINYSTSLLFTYSSEHEKYMTRKKHWFKNTQTGFSGLKSLVFIFFILGNTFFVPSQSLHSCMAQSRPNVAFYVVQSPYRLLA